MGGGGGGGRGQDTKSVADPGFEVTGTHFFRNYICTPPPPLRGFPEGLDL